MEPAGEQPDDDPVDDQELLEVAATMEPAGERRPNRWPARPQRQRLRAAMEPAGKSGTTCVLAKYMAAPNGPQWSPPVSEGGHEPPPVIQIHLHG
jgi:hypothetical protein